MGFVTGGSSSSSIGGSSDVALSNIANKDSLSYDSSVQKWKNVNGSLTPTVITNSQTGTAYTLVLADAGKIVERTNTAANTVTIPQSSAVTFAVNTTIEIYQMGTGETTIVAGPNVLLRSPDGTKIAKQYASVTLRYRGSNEWIVNGNAVPTTGGTSNINAVPTTDLPGWKLLLSEDFSRSAPLGTFNDVYTDWGAYDGLYDTSKNLGRPQGTRGLYATAYTTSVHDNMLDMRVFTSDGTQNPQIPAGQPLVAAPVPNIGSWDQLYGRYSVRFKSDTVEGYKVAWLLWPAQPSTWTSGEIDFPEGALGEGITGFSHQVDGDPNINQYQINTGADMNDWHVATIEWTPTRLSFLLDGVQVGTTTDPAAIPHVKMFWVLQTETWLSATPPPTNSTGHVYVDWVAAWSYNP
jgi:hypothetical protein